MTLCFHPARPCRSSSSLCLPSAHDTVLPLSNKLSHPHHRAPRFATAWRAGLQATPSPGPAKTWRSLSCRPITAGEEEAEGCAGLCHRDRLEGCTWQAASTVQLPPRLLLAAACCDAPPPRLTCQPPDLLCLRRPRVLVLHSWGGEVCGRQRAMPHVKTYLRYRVVQPAAGAAGAAGAAAAAGGDAGGAAAGAAGPAVEVAWMYVGSHNLSKAGEGWVGRVREECGAARRDGLQRCLQGPSVRCSMPRPPTAGLSVPTAPAPSSRPLLPQPGARCRSKAAR